VVTDHRPTVMVRTTTVVTPPSSASSIDAVASRTAHHGSGSRPACATEPRSDDAVLDSVRGVVTRPVVHRFPRPPRDRRASRDKRDRGSGSDARSRRVASAVPGRAVPHHGRQRHTRTRRSTRRSDPRRTRARIRTSDSVEGPWFSAPRCSGHLSCRCPVPSSSPVLDSVAQAAQQDSLATSRSKVCAASFTPSTMVR
jgi:hypothetical protein